MGKRIFMMGDFKSNTGPAIANKALKKALGGQAWFSKGKTRVGRVLELVVGILRSDTVCFCGFSDLNVYGIKLAKTFRRKTAYLMHGYIELEAKINHCEVRPKRVGAEHYILQNVDMIICVSKLLADEVAKEYPGLKNVQVIYNIVEASLGVGDSVEKDSLLVMSTGGGMPRKNNLIVCETIEKINAELPRDKRLKYIIAGKPYDCEGEFKKYDFVNFVGEVSHEECLELMKKSKLYIQNSSFETFGLAVIEAIECGCEVIVFRRIGATEVIENLSSMNILSNLNDIKEIVVKIKGLMGGEGENRLVVKKNLIGQRSVADRLLGFLREMSNG